MSQTNSINGDCLAFVRIAIGEQCTPSDRAKIEGSCDRLFPDATIEQIDTTDLLYWLVDPIEEGVSLLKEQLAWFGITHVDVTTGVSVSLPDVWFVATDNVTLDRPPHAGFPRFWELFPIILPRSLRERIYEPSHEELKEDYLKERGRWQTGSARQWVTFCFTFRTALLVGHCCWAGLSGSARKLLIAVVGLVFGERVVSLLRDKFCEWLGRIL